MSVRPSARNISAPNGQLFTPSDTEHFSKICRKIQVSLKSAKNNGNFTWRRTNIYDSTVSRRILLRVRNVSDKRCIENENTYFMLNNFFPGKSCCWWDNVGKYCTARQATEENTIRSTRFACWITKPTDTNPEYVILSAFPRQRWLRVRASVLR